MESQSTSFIDASNNASDKVEVADSNNDIILVNSEKSNSSNTSTLQKAKKINKKTILIVGDSMVYGTEESNLSKTRHIRVQPL